MRNVIKFKQSEIEVVNMLGTAVPERIIVLCLLAVVLCVHLYHSWIDDGKKRRYTKPFLLVLIMVYYVMGTPEISPWLLAALATSWLGDVLLMGNGDKWFVAGGISFMFSHLLFIATYLINVIPLKFAGVFWPVVAVAAAVYFGTAFFVIRLVKSTTPKSMLPPMYFYLICNSAMNIFALIQMMSTGYCAASVIAYAGAVMFFISDCSLYVVRYYKKPDVIFKQHFTVMLTYVLGELCITQGVMMLSSIVK